MNHPLQHQTNIARTWKIPNDVWEKCSFDNNRIKYFEIGVLVVSFALYCDSIAFDVAILAQVQFDCRAYDALLLQAIKVQFFSCFSVFVCEILMKIELVHDFFCKRSYRLWLYRSPNYGISTTINDIAHASTIYRICEQHRVNILFLNHTFGLCIILTWYAAAADKNYNGIFASKVFCFPSETTLLESLQIA